jgi:hypothetical protein
VRHIPGPLFRLAAGHFMEHLFRVRRKHENRE